jgi:hypothetical protein
MRCSGYGTPDDMKPRTPADYGIGLPITPSNITLEELPLPP